MSSQEAEYTTIHAGMSEIPAEQRGHMIAEAAWYLAEKRGFAEGDTVQDWLSAEAEIDRMLRGFDADDLEVSVRAASVWPDPGETP